MQKLEKLVNDLQRMQAEAKEFTKTALQQEEPELIDLNLAQLKKGENAQGVKIGSYQPYKAITVKIKSIKGWPFGAVNEVTLYDEGDYYAHFYIFYGGTAIVFESSDIKAAELERKYGSVIYGLNKEHLSEARELIKPIIINLHRQFLRI